MAFARTDPATAVLFPGQGSQTPGMRDEVAALRPDLIELAIDAVGADPFEHVDEGTQFQQPAILCASLAGYGRLESLRPAALAGHSLGEIGALTAAGALSEPDAIRLVAARGRLMQEAGVRSGETGMLAVRGGRDVVEQRLEPLGLTLANDNAPQQVVVSGPKQALGELAEQLAAAGTRTIELPVAGAFHSPAMASAAQALATEIAAIEISEPRLPVYSCLTAAPFDDVASALVDGLTRPVRWLDTLRALADSGVSRFVETGPGKVLSGLVRRSLSDVETELASEHVPSHA